MVPATHQQQQLQKQPTATTVTTAEDEALKRNTDCVYFLASPLTCKKGSECDYRHSEHARVNPRDCFYWLNGNCLNPKCGFRHPPLDGLLGTQGPSTGSSTPSSHAAAAPSAPHIPYKMGKQTVPCVFFQKAVCLKGDQCAFVHISKPMSNKMQHPIETTPVLKSQSLKMPFGGLERCTQGKAVSSANDSKAGAHLQAQVAPEVKYAPGTGRSFEKNVPPYEVSEHVIQKNVTNTHSVAGVIAEQSSQLHHAHAANDGYSFQNGKDADDYLRESSPGFDVLVDNELGGSDYYLGEDQYGREEDRKYSLNEYDANLISNADRELYSELQGYESYGGMQEKHYGWGQNRASSGRMSERRPFPIYDSIDHIEDSDLRYRLSKQRRVDNGLRSVVIQDHRHNYPYERNYNCSHRDVPQETFSSRLQGRIKLPGRVNGSDSGSERGIAREKYRSRLSPTDRQHISYQGRLRDRITGRTEDNYWEDRNLGASRRRREMLDETNREFVAPKRLAELKGGKDESISEPLVRKRKSLAEDHHKQSETDASFDGPLPLSEILKRKRGSSVYKEENSQETKKIDQTSVSKNETPLKEQPDIAHDELSEQTRAMGEVTTGEEEVMEGNEYEGDGGEYYEEGYEEDGEYYEEGEEDYVEEEVKGEDGKDVMLS